MSDKKPSFAHRGLSVKLDDLGSGKGADPQNRPPRTGPGMMAQDLSLAHKAEAEAAELRLKLALHDGSNPVRELDPTTVHPSKMANRAVESFDNDAFAELKEQIKLSGGNTQPIMVRLIESPTKEEQGAPQYEIIYGHRRHQACLQLGIKVRAEIVSISDRDLYLRMTTENLARADLSAYEAGLHFRRGLDAGYFQTQAQIESEIGISKMTVWRALTLVEFPDELLSAFPKKTEIQARWVQPLSKALTDNRKELLAKCRKLSSNSARTAPDVYRYLLGTSAAKVSNTPVTVGGRVVGSVTRSGKNLTVKLEVDGPDGIESLLAAAVAKILSNEEA
jgi:ParB family chromosome partitioning protein